MAATHGHGNPPWTVDETTLALDVLARHRFKAPSKKHPDVVDLSKLLRNAPIHPVSQRMTTFRNPDGVYMKMQNLLSNDSPKGSGLTVAKTDRLVWDRYKGKMGLLAERAATIRAVLLSGKHQESDENTGQDDEEIGPEGRVLGYHHRRRERAKGIRQKVLRRARRSRDGICCSGCGLKQDSLRSIPALEEAVFEVHHIEPLSVRTVMRNTRLSDVVLLCANCHRLIHRLSFQQGQWLKAVEFASWLNRNSPRHN